MNWTPEYKKAETTRDISGDFIPFIPMGTKFEVVINGTLDLPFSSCRGLCITSIWNDEFKILED
jgi:hypothetical protein